MFPFIPKGKSGENYREQFRIPAVIWERMREVVDSSQFPLIRSTATLCKMGIIRYLSALDEASPNQIARDYLELVRAELQVMEEETEFGNTLLRLRTRMAELIEMGHIDTATQHAENMISYIGRMPDSSLKDRYLALVEPYRQLLNKGVMSLRPVEEK